MSKTVKGTFVRTSASSITAVFVVNGIPQTFNGNLGKAVEAFTANGAKLTYDDADDLTGARTFDATFRNNDYELNFKNGPKIKGEFNIPGLTNPATVSGAGTWLSN